jgi:excisionase family DNA binding protein
LIERLGTFQQAMATEEVADLLNVSKLTVLRKAKRGTIPAFKVGRIFRYDPRTLAN